MRLQDAPLGALPPDLRYRLALRARHESYSHLLSTPTVFDLATPLAVTLTSTLINVCSRSDVTISNSIGINDREIEQPAAELMA